MAQLCELAKGRKYSNGKNERRMIKDPRKNIDSDNFTTRQKKITKHKLFKINASRSNKRQVVTRDDAGVIDRKNQKESQI
jgi:hypothetical protein